MKLNRFAVYAWGVLGFNVLVILWGAYVRATGSGAGCGSHWPSCNGEVIPRAPQVETMIEFTHRLSSGAAFLLVLGLLVWAWRAYPRGHRVFKGSLTAFIFIIIEALLGAGLVLFELVAQNASLARAISIAIHLSNTFLLLGSLTLTAWWANGGYPLLLRNQGSLPWLLGIGLVGIVLLGISGAMTALGDTLFPASSLAQGLQQDLSATSHFLIRLRVIHPFIAISVGVYLLIVALVAVMQRPTRWVKRFSGGVLVFFFIQLIAGLINIVLLAPVWMQLTHLFLADSIWILFVLLSAAALDESAVAENIQLPDRSTPVQTTPHQV